MSVVYLVALIGVAGLMVALAADAVLAVLRKPRWHSVPVQLAVVRTIERRRQSLPFVGVDRRATATSVAKDAAPRRAA